jgi:hypothetical protein
VHKTLLLFQRNAKKRDCDKKAPEARELQRESSEKATFLAGIAEEDPPNLRYISFDIYFPADEGVTIEWTACICGHCHVCQQAASKTGL